MTVCSDLIGWMRARVSTFANPSSNQNQIRSNCDVRGGRVFRDQKARAERRYFRPLVAKLGAHLEVFPFSQSWLAAAICKAENPERLGRNPSRPKPPQAQHGSVGGLAVAACIARLVVVASVRKTNHEHALSLEHAEPEHESVSLSSQRLRRQTKEVVSSNRVRHWGGR